jgi:hypothetical protein
MARCLFQDQEPDNYQNWTGAFSRGVTSSKLSQVHFPGNMISIQIT